MFKQLGKKLHKGLEIEKATLLLNKICIIRFGSLENAQKEIQKITNDKEELDEKGFQNLMELLLLDRIIPIFQPMLEVKGILSMMVIPYKIKQNLEKQLPNFNESDLKILKIYAENIPSKKEQMDFFLPTKNKKKQSKILNNLAEKYLKTTKGKIAKELGIDPTTFNNWLHYFYGNKYDNARKIKLQDAADIIHKLSLRKEEPTTFITLNYEEYILRLNTDLVHNRESLLKIKEMDGLNYKSLKESLELLDFDSNMKKIPFSIKELILKQIGS